MSPRFSCLSLSLPIQTRFACLFRKYPRATLFRMNLCHPNISLWPYGHTYSIQCDTLVELCRKQFLKVCSKWKQTLERQSARPGPSSASDNQALERLSARTFCMLPSVCGSQLWSSREFELFTEKILTFLLLSYQYTTYLFISILFWWTTELRRQICRDMWTPVRSSFDCTHCHFRGRHTKCFVPLRPSHFIVRKSAYLSSRASQRWHPAWHLPQSASWGAYLLVNSGLRKVTQV